MLVVNARLVPSVAVYRGLERLVKRAQREGKLRKDFKADEIGMLMSGLCASMSGPLPAQRDWRRHLQSLIDGQRARSS